MSKTYTQIISLIEDYKRRLRTANNEAGKGYDEQTAIRLRAKVSEYRTFIAELERIDLQPMQIKPPIESKETDKGKFISHKLEYNIHSAKVSWCPICKEHFYPLHEEEYHFVREKTKDNYCHCKYPLFCPICGKEFLPEIESDNDWLRKILIAYSEFIKEQSEDCSVSISVNDFIKTIANKNKS